MKILKAVLVSMILSSLLSLIGCTDRDKKAIEKIEQHLQEKYGEEFVVDAIGGGYGTLTNNMLKAKVYPTSNPDELFDVAISKDGKSVLDKYMNVIMLDKIEDYAFGVSNSVFNEEIIVRARVGQRGISFPDATLNNREMNVEDYIIGNTDLDFATDVFINTNSKVDAKAGASAIVQIAEQYQAYGIINAFITVYYTNSSEFSEVMAGYERDVHPKEYFERKNMSYKSMYVYFNSYTKMDSIEEVANRIASKEVIL
ncbi:hypothetical protein [Cohnella cholangitidis]|uniref:Lipoprotein n=1 Tax=Cohnella cholangitidis TaxID=2598458 RepID=A0A7G5BU49_9BACL|nr:hypothetical protein [Cohnella cholangitidis]QMV40483.1 hypothetical protein FPL14_04145 [Cohnella cholangitidis]